MWILPAEISILGTHMYSHAYKHIKAQSLEHCTTIHINAAMVETEKLNLWLNWLKMH
jgi:hypothetical protein